MDYRPITDEIVATLDIHKIYHIKEANGTESTASGNFIKYFRSICKEIKIEPWELRP